VLLTALLLSRPPLAAAARHEYYVSIGDSYAIGFQPDRGPSSTGFPDQVVVKARRRGYALELVNFGCGGATSATVLHSTTCNQAVRAIGGPDYAGVTQADAAARFLRRHRDQIALVTIAVGANDMTGCAYVPSGGPECIDAATRRIRRNVAALARRARAAAAPSVPIIGTTYPAAVLGRWVFAPVDRGLAQLAVTAFRSFVNPALRDAYASANVAFADATRASGAYGSFKRVVSGPYGVVPEPVAKVCEYTWYCSRGDIHATTAGYGLIANGIVAMLPARR
jgi:lysophospholipase L1-like esterase